MPLRLIRFYLLLLLAGSLLPFAGCRKEEPPQPPIPRDKLVSVLIDVHLAEAAKQNLIGLVKDSVTRAYYHQIYTIHQIDSVQLQQSLEILRDDPEQLKDVYQEIMDSLKAREDRLR